MTVQNWFCEISKYLRGYSKNKYSVPAGTIKPLPEPVFLPGGSTENCLKGAFTKCLK